MKIIDDTRRFTGIGSLPHHNVDTALEYSFRMGIPFLPQLPIRNPWEFMLPQSLEGLPGLQLSEDGSVTLNLDVWKSQSHLLTHRLEQAFRNQAEMQDSYQSFEPSASISSCWQPFLWELQERNIKQAKIQITGPLTSQWALKIKGNQTLDQLPELSNQIYQLALARGLAMIRRLNSVGIQSYIYIDEPGLYALNIKNPKHWLCIQEIKLMVQTFQKEKALVGIHCCSNTDWEAVLSLKPDLLSIDTSISLDSALSAKDGIVLEDFLENGGRLSLGVIPTTRSSVLHSLDSRSIAESILKKFENQWARKPELIQKIMQNALFTPACGLAFQSISDAELILEKLEEIVQEVLKGNP